MKKNKFEITKNEVGITLIALVITVIVLLIIAGVSIVALIGDNGILTKAKDAKIKAVVAIVKEAVRLEQAEKQIYGEDVNPETLLANGKVRRTVQQGEDGKYYMYYALKEKAYEGMSGLGKGNLANLKDVFLIDDDLNIKYISSQGKEYGDNINNKILKDETKIRFANKAFSEYVSKISGATEEEMKFEWMKNQTSLIIADTSVDSLEDLVFFPNLTSLTLGEYGSNIPPITSLDGIENCTKLTSITIIHGTIKDYSALKYLNNLIYFNRRYGQENEFDNIINCLKSSENLQTVRLSDMNISSMKRISELSNKLETIELSTNNISKIEGLENKINLNSLNLSNNKISEIEGLEDKKKLNSLNLSNNNIVDITTLSNNSALMSLNLIGNINIDANRDNYTGERLEALNKIGEILDKGGNINLDPDKLGLFRNYTSLNFTNKGLTSLEILEGMTELIDLNLFGNNLTLEDEKSQQILSNMTKLETLDLTGNKITNIKALNNLKNLKKLKLEGTNNNVNLAEIENIISNLTGLTVSTESLKTIVNCDVNKITNLTLSGGNLTELPNLSIFNKLITLTISGNQKITNLNEISKIRNLQTLSLINTNLHGNMIDFSYLTNLTKLDLRNNTLWSEDLEYLKALKNNTNLTIDLSNNSIIDASALLVLNPNTKINLTKNINLSSESKQALTEYFGSNVTYDK